MESTSADPINDTVCFMGFNPIKHTVSFMGFGARGRAE